jgi:hypothetical protein
MREASEMPRISVMGRELNPGFFWLVWKIWVVTSELCISLWNNFLDLSARNPRDFRIFGGNSINDKIVNLSICFKGNGALIFPGVVTHWIETKAIHFLGMVPEGTQARNPAPCGRCEKSTLPQDQQLNKTCLFHFG